MPDEPDLPAPGPGRARVRARRSEPGQATVELALVLPVLIVLVLIVVQVGQVVRAQVVVIHTAREVARAAAVSSTPPSGTEVAERQGLDPERLAVDVAAPDREGYVRARVRLAVATDVVLVGPLLPDVPLSAEVQMRAEWVR